MVMPGDNTKMTIELITPIAMEEQLRFAIRERRPHGRGRCGHEDIEITRHVRQSMPRENIIMECTVCKSRNYFTTKNRRKHPERAE